VITVRRYVGDAAFLANPLLVQQLNSQINQQTASALSNFASAFGGAGGQKVTFQLAQAA
jgi:hypothetical protein